MDHAHTGARCRALQHINTVKGTLPRGSFGTIRYEMDNLGRRLVLVDWDTGISVPVFPPEIEMLLQEETQIAA
ncbi:MAG: hypothetical protein ACRERD_04980 [Candidatus Binatia bacterium]